MASRGKFWPEKESMVELRGPGRAILSKYVDRLGTIRLSLLILSATMVFAQPQPAKQLPVLTHSDQVRQLTAEQAAQSYPVRIRGVIIDDVPAPDFFVHDSVSGVYVEGLQSHGFPHHFGDLVEVEGVTGPGKFAPVIMERATRVLGKGTLPKSRMYAFSELTDGQLDSQWIRLRGIVLSVSIDTTSWPGTTLAMRIASGGGQLNVRVPIMREQDFSSWVDSEVIVEGVCGSLFTSQRQLSAVLLYVPRLNFITVEAPAPEVPVSTLLTFSPGDGVRHRVRVRGVVAYQQPGEALFLQSEGKGLRVLTNQDTPLRIGDEVDVLGFPVMGESAPVLEDAVFHLVGSHASPQATPLELNVPWENNDGRFITTTATLLNREMQPDNLRLLLRHGDAVFDATLPSGKSTKQLLSIPLNSGLEIRGICLVSSGGLWSTPQSFRVLLRMPEDVVVLSTPSWWNLRHTLWLLAITMGVLLIVIAWVVVLGRRLREQMDVIRQKLHTSAVLEERNRIARELHDNLEQELAGITMQLDLAVDCFQQAPGVTKQALETARNMSRHSMVEARRSVWDLRCQLLERGDLISALTQTICPLASRDDVKVNVHVSGTPVRLAASIEMNLLRIGQEAVSNAVKHGGAHIIGADLKYGVNKVRLCVSDDGQGFRPQESAVSGHFGLLDMRERAQSMGCHLQVESAPGCGTRVSVEVPLNHHSLDQAATIDTNPGR
jgi:signal transduction histidine kinase